MVSFRILEVLSILLFVVPDGVIVFAHNFLGQKNDPRGWKRVKPSMQKMTAMAFGCPGLDVGELNVTCEQPWVEKRWGAGIDCSAKVPVNTKAYFQNCPPGFALVEDYAIINCKFPGAWDNEIFTCEAIPTTAPPKTVITAKPSNTTTGNATTVAGGNTTATTTKAGVVTGNVTTLAAGAVTTTVAGATTTKAAVAVTTVAGAANTAAVVAVTTVAGAVTTAAAVAVTTVAAVG